MNETMLYLHDTTSAALTMLRHNENLNAHMKSAC